MELIAYHGSQTIKQLYVDRVKLHLKADEIIKGQYWENGKGCAVGCTIHGSDHGSYETELGIPKWLARLEDRIFEGMPNERAKSFPLEFVEAINAGSKLQAILIPMLIFIVESAREKTKNKKSLSAIDGVLIELRKDNIDFEKLKEARAAAYAAADAAYAAADAAYAADAKQNEYVKFADKLLELIRSCK